MNIKSLRIQKDHNKITILALSWRDIESPNKGGAEVQTHAMLSLLPKGKYRIIHFSALYDGMDDYSEIDGITYYRAGNVFSVIALAYAFYKHNQDAIDFVLDQCNTHRFFTPFYVPLEKRIFYIHQMTKEIWKINMKFPFSVVGQFAEKYMTRLYRKGFTITVSESTARDLVKLGFDRNRILIVPQVLRQKPLPKEEFPRKTEFPSFVYVGRFIPYKGIDIVVEALGIIKKKYPSAKLSIIGKYDEKYVSDNLIPICKKYGMTIGASPNDETYDIRCTGFISEKEKVEILGSAHALLFLSVREGWGIPISEAAYVGTPSIVFDSPGLRDAVNFGRAGYVTKERSADAAAECMRMVIEEKADYDKMRDAAYDYTVTYLGKDYISILDEVLEKIISCNR
ncbi:glycosyltransferase family 4 protein [Butyrivibrio proteoclasticus]|nr:glycosyltransferase family 4 protein [Butyrivibrio proteoclasticus]